MPPETTLQPVSAEIFSRLDRLDLKQRDLADLLGLEPNKISKARSGERQFKADEVLRARAWLDEKEAAASLGTISSIETSGGEVVTLQKLDLSLSMGPGTLIDDYVEAEPVQFDLAFIRAITRAPADRLKLVTGIGDSMYPTLNWGDAIMIDTTDRALAKQDGIYWINVYGAAGLKRLRTIAPGRVLVKSDNKAVGDQEVDAADLIIEGRAVWVARGL